MKLVQHLLDSKEEGIVTITREASVYDAIKLMADRTVGSLLVMDGENLKGIVTERDYARKVIIKGRSSESTDLKVFRPMGKSMSSMDRSLLRLVTLLRLPSLRFVGTLITSAAAAALALLAVLLKFGVAACDAMEFCLPPPPPPPSS